uniref:Uncharacterized protein n=1 Tax=Rhizophagus irregularis (strain DAOM 181602 / DAOM 197198 / MUCL 43194) TaxID=747089 RepID=U9U0F4_RHIID
MISKGKNSWNCLTFPITVQLCCSCLSDLFSVGLASTGQRPGEGHFSKKEHFRKWTYSTNPEFQPNSAHIVAPSGRWMVPNMLQSTKKKIKLDGISY